jgi:hypothetical protein
MAAQWLSEFQRSAEDRIFADPRTFSGHRH